MDHLKLYAALMEEHRRLLKLVEGFTEDIKMEFGPDKCETVSIQRGKLSNMPYQLNDGREMKAMQSGDTYEYLGIKQSRRIEHSQINAELMEEFTKQIRINKSIER